MAIFVNPLAFLEVDEPWASTSQRTADLQAVLDFMCSPGTKSDLVSLLARYREVSTEPTRLCFAPAEACFLSKIVWPLRNAKGCYMVGNYLGTISLCGLVAEMAAILLFDISNGDTIGPFDEKAQQESFGSIFERLGQEQRVKNLRKWNLIDDELKSHFDSIRQMRRKYLHFYSEDDSALAKHALKSYIDAVTIVVKVIGQGFTPNGVLIVRQQLLRYLDRLGIVEPARQEKPDQAQFKCAVPESPSMICSCRETCATGLCWISCSSVRELDDFVTAFWCHPCFPLLPAR
jgi:hypothetical protein